jgi:hypothetical protein
VRVRTVNLMTLSFAASAAQVATHPRGDIDWGIIETMKTEAGQTLAGFRRTGEAHEPGGLPQGWTHLRTVAFPRSATAGGTPLALVHTGTLWAVVYGGRSDMSPAKGDVAALVMEPTLGHLAEKVARTKMEMWSAYWDEVVTYVFREFLPEHLGAADPVAFLLCMGASPKTELPERCYDPAFARP